MPDNIENANAAQEAGNEGVEIETKQNLDAEGDAPDVKEGDVSDKKEGAKEGDEDFVPFPKKAQNALNARDRKIAKLHAQNRQMMAELESIRKQYQQNAQAPTKADEGPNEKDFETYGEYLEARADWKAEQKIKAILAEKDQKQQQSAVGLEQQRYVEQKTQAIAAKAQDYAKSIPDYMETVQEHLEMLDYLPPQIQAVFYEADDAALSFYNLAKEGKIAELAQCTPARAAMLIAQAHKTPKPAVTKAPQPMRGATGTGQSAASISNLYKDTDALRQWIKS